MSTQDDAARALTIVDQTLHEMFPEDFDTRCMYAVFGLRALLRESGRSPEIVGGEFLCLVVSRDGRQAALQGFGNPTSEMPSHFWVEVDGSLVDLGPHYLPYRSRFPAVSMPVIRWSLVTPLPHFLRYRESVRYHQDVELQSDDKIMERMGQFLTRCQERSRTEASSMKPPAWQLKDTGALRFAAQKGDPWAQGAITFLRRVSVDQLPF